MTTFKVYVLHAGDYDYRYVGFTTTSLEKRFGMHKYWASKGHQAPLYEWMKKHGSGVVVEAVECCENIKELRAAETKWIRILRSRGHHLFNTSDGPGMLGARHSKESRKLMSEKAFEVQNRPEVKAKIAAASSKQLIEQWKDPAYRKLMKEVLSRPYSEERRSKHKETMNSDRVREKLAATYATEEFKVKKSIACRTAMTTPEARERTIAQNKKMWSDPEYKAKTSEAIRSSFKRRYRCAECDYENNSTHVGRHQKKVGHVGRVELNDTTV